MSIYDERPWLARYDPGQPTDLGVEHETALDMFTACVRQDPGAPMIRYFDGMLTRRELDEAGRRVRRGPDRLGFPPRRAGRAVPAERAPVPDRA